MYLQHRAHCNKLEPWIMEKLVREMLVKLGEDPDREGLMKTPERGA